MKLVVVNDVVYRYAINSPKAVGGSERYQWLLIRALAAAGWDVSVGVHRELAYADSRRVDGVKFVGIGQGNTLLAWHRFLRSEKPDWWLWQCASLWLGPLVLVAKLSNVRVIFSAMHDRDINLRHALTRRSRWWMLYACGLYFSDRIFVQHGGQLAGLSQKFQTKASVLPGIVTLEKAISRMSSSGEPYVVWVAVLRKPKRPDLLIEIAQKNPNLRFVVCGGASPGTPAEYTEQIQQELRTLHNIEYLGHVPPERTLQIIADAAVLLSTSDGEGFPSVFLEAWLLATPVVSMKIDPDGVIEKKKLGCVASTVEKVSSDLQMLMQLSDVRAEMAARAMKHVEESHSEAAAVRTFEKGLDLNSELRPIGQKEF